MSFNAGELINAEAVITLRNKINTQRTRRLRATFNFTVPVITGNLINGNVVNELRTALNLVSDNMFSVPVVTHGLTANDLLTAMDNKTEALRVAALVPVYEWIDSAPTSNRITPDDYLEFPADNVIYYDWKASWLRDTKGVMSYFLSLMWGYVAVALVQTAGESYNAADYTPINSSNYNSITELTINPDLKYKRGTLVIGHSGSFKEASSYHYHYRIIRSTRQIIYYI